MSRRYTIIFSASAEREILDATQWYIDQNAVDAGLVWAEAIRDCIMSLSEFPLRCPVIENVEGAEIRQLLFGKRHGQYRILFTISGNLVHILHIRHVARDKAAI